MNIRTESTLFTDAQTKKICIDNKAIHVIDTEYQGIPCAVFYSRIRHPKSGSRYFAVNLTKDQDKWKDALHVSDGAFIEDQKFNAIVVDNGDIIYSRHRYDSRTLRSKVEASRLPTLTVFKGRVEYWDTKDKNILT
tara:strand:- start:122 stop:529 length:408 start_codon:yes stop_codon:yes gene_type:complete